MHSRPRLIAALWCAALAVAAAPPIVHAASKSRDKPSEPAAPVQAGVPGSDAVLCNSLSKTLMGKIASMKGIELSIAKDREQPAATLSGLFTEWSGGTYTGTAIEKKMRRLERERGMATELNRLLASSGCAQLDIDAEMQKAKPVPAVEDDEKRQNDPLANDPLRGRHSR